MKPIQMVDLGQQYLNIKEEVDLGIQTVINTTSFIKGPAVSKFESELSDYLNGAFVIGCGNGTDALQIALMAAGLKPGDEVIVPAFTYVATIEVIGLLGLIPILIDAEVDTFNMDVNQIEKAYSSKTKAIVPVHLYGQPSNMDFILKFAKKNNLFVIEDTAQAIGAECKVDGRVQKVATIGDMGCLSFFPSKNLGCYGDGGAVVTKDENLASRIRMIANHGQTVKYKHDFIGVNSRLDSIQAAVLSAKLPHLDEYSFSRNEVARKYDKSFSQLDEVIIPKRTPGTTHVFHQYTIRVRNGKRDALKQFLAEKSVPSMIYYPIPVHLQKGYLDLVKYNNKLAITELLCEDVLSLPIHTEMDESQIEYITSTVIDFF